MPPPASLRGPSPEPAQRARLATLAAIDGDADLREHYVLKGGLVFQHVYGSPRPSDDLDFNHAGGFEPRIGPAERAHLRALVASLDAAVGASAEAYGLARAGVRLTKWSEVLPIVFAEVTYTAAGSGEGIGEASGAVELQVTLSEVVCRTVRARIDGVPVLAAALEDAVADKLKTLLQQVPRHQVRQSDVYDLWFALEGATFVPDVATVASCLWAKTAPYPNLRPLTPARFREPAVRSFAEAGYRKLRGAEPDLPFAPFDAVWETILGFVDTLGLEEGPPR